MSNNIGSGIKIIMLILIAYFVLCTSICNDNPSVARVNAGNVSPVERDIANSIKDIANSQREQVRILNEILRALRKNK